MQRQLSDSAKVADLEQRLARARKVGAKKSSVIKNVRCQKKGHLRNREVTVTTTTTITTLNGEERGEVATAEEVELEKKKAETEKNVGVLEELNKK